MSKTFYLAGPMSGYPQFNFPAFHEGARALRERGYKIISPAEEDSAAVQAAALKSKDGKLDAEGKVAGETWGEILARDVRIVADKVDGIIFLPGWRSSRGARLEAFVGVLCKRKFFYYLGDGRTESVKPEVIMREIYGHTDDSYETASI